MAQRRITFARLQQIYRRQDPPAWGEAYQPGILATREEAPAMSRAAQLWSEKLQRYVHALSSIEQSAVRLALFHPRLFELQEQRMLPADRRQHPLAGHPRATGIDLPDLPGTIPVAERLDLLQTHGWVSLQVKGTDGKPIKVPTPFFGDLLLFLVDAAGPYCVNWTVKSSSADFGRSIDLRRRVRDPDKDQRSARARHAIEEQLYLGAGIRTVRVVADSIPRRLDDNLRVLFLNQRCFNPLLAEVELELESRISASLCTGEPPQAAILGVTHRHNCEYQDVRQAFFRLLWERRVRVELVDESIFVDQPLATERNDVLTRYGHLFNREV